MKEDAEHVSLFIRKELLSVIQSSDCALVAAAGNRNRETGALDVVGSNGYAWSSSTYASGNINAGNLRFIAGEVQPLNGNNRANGFPVRCVQHLSLFLSFLTIFEPEQHIHCL